jgi:hypothetical protein
MASMPVLDGAEGDGQLRMSVRGGGIERDQVGLGCDDAPA